MSSDRSSSKLWLFFALITTLFWGVWGALIEIPERAGFPATLSYVVWSLTMIPPAVVALKLIDWKLDRSFRSIVLGMSVGLLGAGGQLVLFQTLSITPAYLVYPLISLSPVVTILMAFFFLGERTHRLGWIGILAAMIAIPLLSWSPPEGDGGIEGGLWMLPALLVFLAWGVQSFIIKFANETMQAENIFFYMMLSAILMAPFAWWMTDWSEPIHWGFAGPGAAALIQSLNAIGALFLVYAFRYGKAMIVSPLCNAVAPVITIILSLAIYSVWPHPVPLTGMILAILATFLLSVERDDPSGDVEESGRPLG